MMRTKIWLLLLVLLASSPAFPCSTFCFRADGRIIFGKNYDWDLGEGMLVVNKRGMSHISAEAKGESLPARWRSIYGSVTFNQYGRNFPSGGMNEAGLVVELMWAAGSKYPSPDQRPSVGCLEWIQYQLDTSRNIADVIASDLKIRIESEIPLHFLIADRDGNVAAIEFVGGKMLVHEGADLPVAALTNDLYADSLRYLGKTSWIPEDAGSRARFIRAAHHVRDYKSGEPVAYAFGSLANLASAITQWSIVYEIDRGQVHFRTQNNPGIRTISLNLLDFSCAKPVLIMDLDTGNGDVFNLLHPYTQEANAKLIRSSFSRTEFLADTSAAEIQRIATSPDNSTCRE